MRKALALTVMVLAGCATASPPIDPSQAQYFPPAPAGSPQPLLQPTPVRFIPMRAPFTAAPSHTPISARDAMMAPIATVDYRAGRPSNTAQQPAQTATEPVAQAPATAPSYPPSYTRSPGCTSGNYYGAISCATGLPKTTYVRPYFRKDGTFVSGHYRSRRR